MLVVCVVCASMCMCVLCCMLFVEACVHVCGIVCECVCSYACVHICYMLFVQACVHVCGVCVAHMLTLCVVCERMGVLICMCTHIDHVHICGHVCSVCVLCLWVCTYMFSSNRNSLKRNVFWVSYISSMYWWNRKPNGKEFPVHPPSIPAAWCISGC